MKSKRSWVATNRLKTNQLFGSIFPRDGKMVDAIADHMLANGYDDSLPIIVWDRTEEENNRHALYIVDGHTRKCAAATAGISPVYVAKVKFTNEGEALQYAIHNQRDRRNITDADLLRCIQAMDNRKSRGGDRRSQEAKSKSSSEPIENKSSAQQTADIVGTSETKVKKVRSILDHADEQTKQDVLDGTKRINKAYTETQKKRKSKKRNSNPQFEMLTSMPDFIQLEKIHKNFFDKLAAFHLNHREKKRLRKEYLRIFDNWTGNLKALTEMWIENTTSKLQVIYEPSGEAAEYSKLALNLYTGCTHGCLYCYGPSTLRKSSESYHAEPSPRQDILKKLESDCELLSPDDCPPIHLSFLGDCYQPANDKLDLTRHAIRILIDNSLPFQLLTKGGTRALRDFDLLENYRKCMFGVSLSLWNQKDADYWEPHAAPIVDRAESLKIAHSQGIKTWVSLEPVIYPEQALEIINELHPYVDHWKVGKINHNKDLESKTDWVKLRSEVTELLDSLDADYYIKTSLLL